MARQLEARLEEPSASASASRRRSGAWASRSAPASTASACSRSWSRPPSTASAPPPGARACATTRTSCHEVARTGEPESFRRALHAAEAAVIDAGQVAEIQVGGASALAAPLGASEDSNQVIGIVSVARGDRVVHARRARAVRLPHQPGERLGRERRPARDRAAPGGDRRADRPVQPPPLPGGHDGGGRARPPLRPRAGPDHARHRQLQGRQRHVRPPPGRHGAGRGRARPAPVLARDRRAGPLRRRGDGRRAAADRPRGRLPVRRARPPPDRGARAAPTGR